MNNLKRALSTSSINNFRTDVNDINVRADVNSVTNFFAQFDMALKYHAPNIEERDEVDDEKKRHITLKELTTFKGTFLSELYLFLGWLVEDVVRETYLSKQCNIRFLNIQPNMELIKVYISTNSRCTVHLSKLSENFIKYCSISWTEHCIELHRNARESIKCGHSIDGTNSLDGISDGKKGSHKRSESSEEENIQLLRIRYAITSSGGNLLLNNRYIAKRLGDAYPMNLVLCSESSDFFDESEYYSMPYCAESSEPTVDSDYTERTHQHSSELNDENGSSLNASVSKKLREKSTRSNENKVVKLSKLPETATELCTLFKIQTEMVFLGEYLEKKFDHDFLYKKRFVWIVPASRSLYWAKNAEEKEKHLDHCKFLVLKRNVALKKVLPGVKKGIAYDVAFDANGMSVRTECGQLLTVKIPANQIDCWQRVVLSLYQ